MFSKFSHCYRTAVHRRHIHQAGFDGIRAANARVARACLFSHNWSRTLPGTTTFSTAAASTPPGGVKEPTDILTGRLLIQHVAATHELTYAKAERIVNTVFGTIVDALVDERRVKLSKFGSFEPYMSKETTGRNPRSGEKILVPAKKRIRFKAFSSFRNSVNKEDGKKAK
jgi:nucleoid DNA-binding protein